MNAVVYVRVSTAEQADNYSLDSQLKACLEFSRSRGLSVVEVFRGEGESAKTAKRPQLQAMLNYCAVHRGQVDVLLIHRTDRLARNMEDYVAIKASLKRVGVTVMSVAEDFDDSPAGRFIENVLASVAQFNNDHRSHRTKEAMRSALAEGRWQWIAPIGYVNCKKSL